MHYNPHRISTSKWFNCLIQDLLKTLIQGAENELALYLPSLIVAYNATTHSSTRFQPYELTFCCKVTTVCYGWLGLANYNDQFPIVKHVSHRQLYDLNKSQSEATDLFWVHPSWALKTTDIIVGWCLICVHQEMTGQSSPGIEVPATGGQTWEAAAVKVLANLVFCWRHFLFASDVCLFSNCCSSGDEAFPGSVI